MKTFDTNPNQKKIKIQKEDCNKDNKYTIINLDALQAAMVNLTNAQFKVWVYLAKNADNYQLDLSPAEAACNWNIKKTTMQETIREFIHIGYLEKSNDREYYIFHESPISAQK